MPPSCRRLQLSSCYSLALIESVVVLFVADTSGVHLGMKWSTLRVSVSLCRLKAAHSNKLRSSPPEDYTAVNQIKPHGLAQSLQLLK